MPTMYPYTPKKRDRKAGLKREIKLPKTILIIPRRDFEKKWQVSMEVINSARPIEDREGPRGYVHNATPS